MGDAKKEIRRLRRIIRQMLEVRKRWSSVVNPNYRDIVDEMVAIAESV